MIHNNGGSNAVLTGEFTFHLSNETNLQGLHLINSGTIAGGGCNRDGLGTVCFHAPQKDPDGAK